MQFKSTFDFRYGIGMVFSSTIGICRVLLPSEDSAFNQLESRFSGYPSSLLTEQTAIMLKEYFKGVCQDFSGLPVDLGDLSQFRARILQLIRAIPFGEVWSYGYVAKMADFPGGARAIGGAMASNPVPIIIPCHRVVGANGKLTGFTAPGGLKLKKILLQMEGVEFKGEVVSRNIDSYKQDKVGMKKI